MKEKRAKACDISKKVKEAVCERDGGECILCGRLGMPNAHYIPRSSGGLGVEQNIVTLCAECHQEYDQTSLRPLCGEMIRDYLQARYKGWNENDLIYRNEMRCGR